MSDLKTFDYTNQGRRPSARQIFSDWKKLGTGEDFSVEYGETYANFQRVVAGRWHESGNGCRGVDRSAVVKLLEAATRRPRDEYESNWIR